MRSVDLADVIVGISKIQDICVIFNQKPVDAHMTSSPYGTSNQ